MLEFLVNNKIAVSDELKTEIEKSFTTRFFEKGEYFHKVDTVCNSFGYIKHGKIAHYYNLDGKMMTRWISLPGTLITSFASFLNKSKSLDSLYCITSCEIEVTSRDQIFYLKEKFPEIQNLWTQSLEHEMVGYEHRVFQLITRDAERRYINFVNDYPEFIREVPQKYIASMLGIEPRHLSRIRKKLSTKK